MPRSAHQSSAPTEASTPTMPSAGFWATVWARLTRSKRAFFGLTVILFFTLVAVLAPVLAPHNPLELGFGQAYLPPSWVRESATGRVGDPQFFLGTDTAGRDILSRLIYGTRASMFIGLSVTPIVGVLGTVIGLAAGYTGGRKGSLIMRVTDIFNAFPAIMFYVLIALIVRETAFGLWMNGLATLLLALVLIGWVGLARQTRSAVLSIKESQFVEAARSVGATNRRIVMRHVLPNCLSLIVIWMAFAVPRMIMVEAMLGYLGIGLTPVVDSSQSFFVTTWGGLLLDGRMAINTRPLILLAPALCVALVGMAFTFVGDALRDLLDPRMRDLV
jgi:ABC-type dipeptide/oligopeptide/nickel transport system permease subunit